MMKQNPSLIISKYQKRANFILPSLSFLDMLPAGTDTQSPLMKTKKFSVIIPLLSRCITYKSIGS